VRVKQFALQVRVILSEFDVWGVTAAPAGGATGTWYDGAATAFGGEGMAGMVIAGKSVNTLVRILVEICLLRAGPADLPASQALLGLALVTYATVGVLVLTPGSGLGGAVVQSVADVALLIVLLRVGLQLRRVPERFNQTLAALAGTGAMIGFAAWPLIATLHAADVRGELAPLPSLLLLGLFLWSLAVIGHVLRHALVLSYAAGVLVATVYIALSMSLFALLFPQGAAP
jgi:hypothetical protein